MGDCHFATARLTVRLGAIAANYRHFVALCPGVEVAAAVKADAYGLGAAGVTPTLAAAGCSTFFVARLEEGIALRPLRPDARIFLLDGVRQGTETAVIAHRLIPALNSLAEVSLWSAAAASRGETLDCAVHFDTGMNRLGLPAYEQPVLAAQGKHRLRHLNVVLWMSHLACAEDSESPMNALQRDRFRELLAQLPPACASLCASAGALLGREYHFDLVRPGIGLYGGNPSICLPNPFSVVAVLTGKILQVRRVDSGESVGYGATFRATRPTVLATVGLGYADGLMRVIGNKGRGAITGVSAPIVGRVSMDLATLDVTNVPASALQVGADVEFLGDTISLEEFASLAGTASYEVLTSLGHRLPRHYEPAA
ncbi:MAG: alanine racemase [Alphaproteobacteria bacterium]|nr:alanine racemase [Alphaproteobacteria bacterium]MBV9061356.1 alanine racemase [Alphaproteobacteria bacterium]